MLSCSHSNSVIFECLSPAPVLLLEAGALCPELIPVWGFLLQRTARMRRKITKTFVSSGRRRPKRPPNRGRCSWMMWAARRRSRRMMRHSSRRVSTWACKRDTEDKNCAPQESHFYPVSVQVGFSQLEFVFQVCSKGVCAKNLSLQVD